MWHWPKDRHKYLGDRTDRLEIPWCPNDFQQGRVFYGAKVTFRNTVGSWAMTHAYNPSTWEAQSEGPWVWGETMLHSKTVSKRQDSWVWRDAPSLRFLSQGSEFWSPVPMLEQQPTKPTVWYYSCNPSTWWEESKEGPQGLPAGQSCRMREFQANNRACLRSKRKKRKRGRGRQGRKESARSI